MGEPNDAQGEARRRATLIVVVAALGYFVDIYDLILFGILRKPSLLDLGVAPGDLLDTGIRLFDMQMGGMLLGGILWGILGDKRGRVSVLFGSIFLYSVANVANGFVTSVEAYGWLRLLAGIGLAGELGAGITLVSEILPRHARGWGTTAVATVGVCGAVAAALVGTRYPWRTSYFIGGGLGLALLVLRVGMLESGLFARIRSEGVRRGRFLELFTSWRKALLYVSIILIGVPIWYVVSILVTFSPEIGGALGVAPPPEAARAILWCYVGLGVGDLASGALSQLLRSRKRVVAIYLALTAGSIAFYFLAPPLSQAAFYGTCLLLGCAAGYWAMFVTMAAEHFGTNLRATVTTTAPNFVRGAVVGITAGFQALKPHLGVTHAAIVVGAVVMALAALALTRLHETFGRDLDFVEGA